MTVIHVDYRRPKERLSGRTLLLMVLAADACFWIAVPWAICFWGHR